MIIRYLLKQLYIQVLIAILLGIFFGTFYPEIAVNFKPFGDAFIKLIKAIIGPFIFCMIVTSIVGMEDLKEMGRIGIKMIIYFEIITTLALIIGLFVGHIIKPGHGMHADLSGVDVSSLAAYSNHDKHSVVHFLMNIIPNTFVDAFVHGDILPILFVSIFFGFALYKVKNEAKIVIDFIEQFSQILFKIIGFIMKLAPLGAFGAMSYTIGQYGIASLIPLISLIITFYITCLLFIFIVLGIIAYYCGFNIWKFLKYIKEEIMIVFSSSSSETVFPLIVKKLEDAGCPKLIARLTISTGYNFNLDGTCIYFTLAILFIAQATDTHLTLWQELNIILILLITSKGATGVVGSAFVALAATLSVTNIVPFAGLTLILGIDRFMSEARSVTNIISNSVASMAIAKWENKLNYQKMKQKQII